jgi:hypothetical protein
MDEGAFSEQCANALSTSASPVSDSGWYKSGGKLNKSVFVFAATVANTNRSDNKDEPYKGNKGFAYYWAIASSLEIIFLLCGKKVTITLQAPSTKRLVKGLTGLHPMTSLATVPLKCRSLAT